MNNRTKYNFDDFTHAHYLELLGVLNSQYNCTFYSNDISIKPSTVFWRHDVDYSLEEALNLAFFEAEKNINSTYFVLLHGEFYSPLEKKSADIIRQILALGHQLGLHFDTHFYGIRKEAELEDKLLFERNILESIFECRVNAFSFHNTTDFTMGCKNWKYGGMINTYASFFQENTDYCSDSNGYWRFERLIDFLRNDHQRPLQVLTHPEWWTKDVMSPKQKIDMIIDSRASKNKELYARLLASFGRENIDW